MDDNTIKASDVGVSGFFPRVTTDVTPADIKGANVASTKMLLAISATGKHLYEGTVDPVVKAARRARNRRASAARRLHRKARR